MKRIVAAVALAAALVVVPAATAQPPTHRQFGVYRYLYRHARHEFGAEAVGCELKFTCHGKVTVAKIDRSDGVLDRLMHPYVPPPPAPVVVPATVPTAATGVVASQAPTASYGGGYSIPASIVQCESGGDWSAVNSKSGAGGAYQILPSTWAAYGGTGRPQDASPAQQSAIAAQIWAKQGPGAWTC